jgi:hypothetical protein
VHGRSAKARKRLLERVAAIRAGKKMTFITLTYIEDDPNIENAKEHLHAFLQRLYRKAPKSALIWSLEFQKRGAIHFHILAFSLPYITKESIQKAWGDITNQHRPFTRIEMVRSRKKALVYVCKYMAKPASSRSGFNYAPYPNAKEEIWTGRTWGMRRQEYLPLAEKHEFVFGVGRKTAENMRLTQAAYYILKMRAAQRYPPVEFYENIGFTVFCDNAIQLLGVLTSLPQCIKLDSTSNLKD